MRHALLSIAVLTLLAATAQAEDFSFDGRLEPGDPTLDGPYAPWYDSFDDELAAGERVEFRVSGMSVTPYFLIYDANNNRIYDTMGDPLSKGFNMTWTAPEAGEYYFLLTESYREETDYHIEGSTEF